MTHGSSYHLGRKFTDDVSTVSIAVPTGVEHEFLALLLLLPPELLPESPATHVGAKVLSSMARPHRWHDLGSQCFLELPGLRPVIAGQQSQHPGSGAAPTGNLLVGRP